MLRDDILIPSLLRGFFLTIMSLLTVINLVLL